MLGCGCAGMSLLPHGVHRSAQLCTDPRPPMATLSPSVGMRPLKQLAKTSVHKAGDCWDQSGGLGVPVHPRIAGLMGRELHCCSCDDLCVTAKGLGCQCSTHSDIGWESHIQSSVTSRLAAMSHVCDATGVVPETGATSGGLWVTQFGRRPGTWCCCPPGAVPSPGNRPCGDSREVGGFPSPSAEEGKPGAASSHSPHPGCPRSIAHYRHGPGEQ